MQLNVLILILLEVTQMECEQLIQEINPSVFCLNPYSTGSNSNT